MSENQPKVTEYYFNTRTKMVETGRQSSWEHLLGPYASADEAAHALEIAKQRNEHWEDDEAKWDDDDN